MSKTRLVMKIPPENLSLSRLIEEAKAHKMTAEEIREQRRSWVRGELMLAHPEMTIEEANALIDKDPAA